MGRRLARINDGDDGAVHAVAVGDPIAAMIVGATSKRCARSSAASSSIPSPAAMKTPSSLWFQGSAGLK